MPRDTNQTERASATGLSMKTIFVSARSPVGTLSGLFDLPPSVTESDVRALELAMSESGAEVVGDWLATATGEHDAS